MAQSCVLVSLCLCGVPCRYHGLPLPVHSKVRQLLQRNHTLIPVCPEIMGGLPTPRTPAPLRNKQGEIIRDRQGRDVTHNFKAGAQAALDVARLFGCRRAYLLNNSPSCDRSGFLGELLIQQGIEVIPV